jgi:hypothetical protein
MRKIISVLSIVAVLCTTSYSLNAQVLSQDSDAVTKVDSLPKERMCDIKAYSDEVISGIYKSSYGINLYVDFPDFPRFKSTGNNYFDKVEFLNRVDSFIQSSAEFRRRIGMTN